MARTPAVKHGDLIEVLWEDAYTPGTGYWQNPGSWSDERCIIHSYGLFIERTPEFLTIAQSIDSAGDALSYGGVFRIPQGFIQDLHLIRKGT